MRVWLHVKATLALFMSLAIPSFADVTNPDIEPTAQGPVHLRYSLIDDNHKIDGAESDDPVAAKAAASEKSLDGLIYACREDADAGRFKQVIVEAVCAIQREREAEESGAAQPLPRLLDPSEPHLYLALAYLETLDNDSAVAEATLALRLHETPSALNIRGSAKKRQGEFAQAVSDFSAAIKLRPHEAQYYRNRAVSYSALNKQKLALKDLNQAIKLQPNYAVAYLDRSRVLRALDKQSAAQEDELRFERVKDTPQDFGYFEPRRAPATIPINTGHF